MEYSYLDSMDINGKSRIILSQKGFPITMVTEGYYQKNTLPRSGFRIRKRHNYKIQFFFKNGWQLV